ncbi:hypothetical protein QBC42DRAFT_323869 [Cladorrhinum samala]|uniref:Uncharacterized protein n=1 Tax=Cladorrhinum samala TaxID=585594 RepID=A0AAV9HSC9_9PEZI|nr:hypothetical protein QBC42DRAFT_323869 [Cladorrhinum samala]
MDVQTGPWKDHSRTGWDASMITVDVRKGALLISGLTIFITLVSGRFWAIVAFAVHQWRAADDERDGIHHQHQLVYRNSSSHLDTLWQILRISWAWRRRARLNLARTIIFLLPPVLCFAAFTAAGLFSTKVTTPLYLATRVRVAPRNCGYLNWGSRENFGADGNLSEAGSRVYGKWYAQKIMSARSYARSCYANETVSSQACSVLPVQQFLYSTSDAAPCPFAQKRCISGRDASFKMVTQWLDSHEHFGINSPKSERVSIRRSATCSVLNVDDLTRVIEGSPASMYQYMLGSTGTNPPNTPTYQILDWTQNANFPSFTSVAFEANVVPGWLPIADLNRTDADVTLLALNQNSMIHPSPVDDPFFAAHRRQGPVPGILNGGNFYTADNITAFMGCAEQFELRNNANNVSTALSSYIAVANQRNNIGLTETQSEISLRLLSPVYQSLIGRGMYTGQGDVLRASQSAWLTVMSAALPADQWQVELRGWFEHALAMHQLEAMSFASKDVDGLSPYGQVVQYNKSSITNKLCGAQIMRNTGGYQSFSALGLGLIGAVGVLIAVVSWVLESAVAAVRAKRGRGEDYYKSVAWRMDSMFDQQRLAFGAGIRDTGDVEWDKIGSGVPVTKRGEVFRRAPA